MNLEQRVNRLEGLEENQRNEADEGAELGTEVAGVLRDILNRLLALEQPRVKKAKKVKKTKRVKSKKSKKKSKKSIR